MKTKSKIEQYNENSMNVLQEQNPFLIPTNPGFFDPDLMETYGFQDFNVVNKDNKNYLHVDRYVVLGDKAVQIQTSVYSINKKNVITSLANKLKNKITTVMKFRKNVLEAKAEAE